ncbi:MAG: hypothetical protein Fur0018_25950 [Anaerolineales bacterium]
MSESFSQRFVAYLQSLAEKQERGALAALRRGLGQPPGQAPEMYPYVIPYLPAGLHPEGEAACYLLASLFAFHPESAAKGNMGDHMAAAARQSPNSEAIERRFTVLLNAHPDDLPAYLRQTVSFLKAKGVPVNWEQLLRDLLYWAHPDYGPQIRKRWANAFWGRPQETAESES